MELAGYRLDEQIFQSTRTQVYRATREGGGERVILKIAAEEHPSPRAIAAFERAFEIGRQAAGPGVPEHLELARCGAGWALVMADSGSISLDRLLAPGGVELGLFFDVAVKICRSLAHVHGARIVHKDIKPANMIFNEATGEVQIIDFGIASQLDREEASADAPDRLEGTLFYMSPEQTGRMNRAVDDRSDLYALGVTLYELATGVTPFASDDPIEVLHGHIARLPRPPHALREGFPVQVSAIVLRLLAKSAEERYASAIGVQRDLVRARDDWRATGRCAPFALGAHDVSPRFRIPEKLYGREAETEALLAAFARSAAGERALLTVLGYSGIGKSSLVREVQRPIAAQNGHFCVGKFEQFRRDLPYFALVQALSDLLRQVLTEAPARVEAHRARVLEALGQLGRVMTDVVPELTLLIGEQPPVPQLGVSEAQSRFHRMFLAFVRVFARAEHPLVLFLDDLQWADASSLALVELLATEPDLGFLLVIGGVRDNEVGPGHIVQQALARVGEAGLTVGRLSLSPLSARTVSEIVAETLSCDEGLAGRVGALVHAKTAGNPFFVLELLRAMHARGVVAFDATEGAWGCDEGRLRSLEITDNVVDLMTQKLRELPGETVDILRTAACLGAEFDLSTLAAVSAMPARAAAVALSPALMSGVLQPTNGFYKYAESAAIEGDDAFVSGARYRFQHDRVQQAADDLLDAGERARRHLGIGRALLARVSGDDRRAQIVDIVEHLDRGAELVTSAAERLELARMNFEAGGVAADALAFGAARRYFEAAVALLPADAWSAEYDLSLALYTRLAQAIAADGDKAGWKRIEDVVSRHARSEIDRVPLHIIRQRQLSGTGDARFVEALEFSLEVIARFGVKLPRHPKLPHILAQVAATEALVFRKPASAFLDLPPMTDPTARAAVQLLGASAESVYFAEQNLMPLVGMTMVRLSIRHGLIDWSSYGFAIYAFVLAGALGRIERGYEFGQMATELGRRAGGEFASRANFLHDCFVRHWKEPPRDLTAGLLANWTAALDLGDEQTATYCAGVALYNDFFGGLDLPALLARHADSIVFLSRCRQVHVRDGFLAWVQLFQLLTAPGELPLALEGKLFSMPERLPAYLASNNGVVVALSSIAAGVLDLTAGRFDPAHEHFSRALGREESVLAQVVVPGLAFLTAHNALAAALSGRSRFSRRELVGAAKKQLKRLRGWQRHAPFNQDARVQILDAMLADLDPGAARPVELYARAIDAARELGLPYEEHLACERAREFAARSGLATLAEGLGRRAAEVFQRWAGASKAAPGGPISGPVSSPASGPVASVEPAPSTRRVLRGEPTVSLSSADSISVSASLAEIDLMSVMKSSQAISGALVLDDLIQRLLRSLLENAAAQRGFLILKGDPELVVEATDGAPEIEVTLHRAPMESRGDLAKSIVRYVERTRERVVLGDARVSGQFQGDPYLVSARPKSVLCMPIIRQQRLVGLLYLENNLATNAFTEGRCRMLELLSVQAAISLENARLYDTLEARVKERTQQLEESLVAIEKAQAALSAELQDAATYVRSLLPAPLTAGPVRIDWSYVPSAHLGGDALGYSQLDDGRLAFYVVDVAGHGLASALLSISILTALHGRRLASADYGDPGSVLRALNDAFPSSTTGGRHFTMWYGVLDPATRELSCANGGHPCAVVCGADGSRKEVGEVGVMLGVLPSMTFAVETVRLRDDDTVFVFSDGAFELETAGSMLDYERFLEQLSLAASGGEGRVQRLLDFAVDVRGGPLEDDFTMLCVTLG